jgi:hypothetical protein
MNQNQIQPQQPPQPPRQLADDEIELAAAHAAQQMRLQCRHQNEKADLANQQSADIVALRARKTVAAGLAVAQAAVSAASAQLAQNQPAK